MAKKLYEEASVLAIANAIRAKNGSTATYKVAQMADAVLAIAPLQPDVEEYPQMSTTVAAYLTAAEAAYTDANGGSVSVLDSYTGASGIKDAPLGKALTMQGGTRYQQDETTGIGGKLNNILGGESVIYNAVPGHVLRYIVKGSGGDVIDSGRVKPTGTVRMMKFIGYVKNCRDLGGWACDGGTVRYGRMYRCAAPGAAESADANIAQNANIRHHFDLRDNASLESSPFGSEVYYKRYPLSAYYIDLVDLTKSHYAEMAALLRAVFDVVIHGNGVIYHCSLGRDRTGTLSFILLALLGVSRKHVDMDYELSGFSSLSDAGTPQKRTSANYTGLANYFASFGKSSLRDNVVKWALKAGLTIDELNAYRSAAINGTPAALNASDYVTQYTLTQHLTDCTSNAAGTEISEGAALSVTITPNAGKKLGSISVTMGGTDITVTAVSGSTVHIASVTGNVVITAVATAAYTNQIPISTDAGGAVFNGVGYQQGYRLSSSGSPSPQASTYITGFIPVHSGDTVRFEGMNLKEGSAAINEQRIAFYDANKAVIAAPYWKDTGTNTMSGGYLASLTVPAYSGKTVAFARFGCYWIDSHSIITVNEEIG